MLEGAVAMLGIDRSFLGGYGNYLISSRSLNM
jgi:hypothetical protein